MAIGQSWTRVQMNGAVGLHAFAKHLKDNQTPSEKRLHSMLAALGIHKEFEAQIPILGWVADFYHSGLTQVLVGDAPFVLAPLVVEVDGSTHETAARKRKDAHRDEVMSKVGIRVVRYSNKDVHEKPNEIAHHIWELVSKDRHGFIARHYPEEVRFTPVAYQNYPKGSRH